MTSGPDLGRTIEVGTRPIVVGRDPSADLPLTDGRVSWRHARLTALPDGRAIVEDLGSTNGTFVNGQRVSERSFLGGGETISLGGVEVAIEAPAGASPALASPLGTPAQGGYSPPAGPSAPLGQPPAFPAPGGYGTPPPVASPSVIQRVMLQRSVRRANVLAAIAVVASLVVVVVVAAGFLLRPPTPSPSPAPATVADIAEQAEPSTVLVVALSEGERAGNGTGWVWDADAGLIVTNLHVVNAGETFQIGVDSMLSAEVVGGAPCDDLAVLRVTDTSGLRTMPLGEQSAVRRGDTVIALGYPVNASPTDDLQVTVGNVSAVQVSYDPRGFGDVPAYPNVVQVTTPINPGNSGGPLVDLNGRLVGVNTAGPPVQVENTNYAIGVDRVREVVPVLSAGTSTTWLGLGFDAYVTQAALNTNQRLREALEQAGWPVRPGILVEHLIGGTADPGIPLPAYIVAVNGRDLDGRLQSYCEAVSGTTATSARLTVYGSGQTAPSEIDVPFR